VRALLRPALALTGVVAVVLASAAAAAPAGPKTLSFKDAAGDNISPGAASDITGVTFTTTGTGKGKKYVAKNLVVQLALAAAPDSNGTTIYEVDTQLAGCGAFTMSYSPGARLIESSGFAECGGDGTPTGSGTLFDALPEVKGSTMTWTLPLKSLPGDVKVGSSFTKLYAYTDLVDPVTGLLGPAVIDNALAYDSAATDASYIVG
jgi:hypothetical protein